MAQHIDTGKTGECLAAEWLVRNGFTVIQRNWRHHRYEVDIIAGRRSILHFIEVKTRRSLTYGHPEESVSKKKLEHVMEGAVFWPSPCQKRPRLNSCCSKTFIYK
jgi:putative endonuclease